LIPVCTKATLTSVSRPIGDSPIPVDDGGGDLRYARLRLELTRLARRVAGPSRAEDLVQTVFRHVARHGPAAPRDARGVPRPAYLAALVHALAESTDGNPEALTCVGEQLPASLGAGGARGG
jgi:hypothetical protein